MSNSFNISSVNLVLYRNKYLTITTSNNSMFKDGLVMYLQKELYKSFLNFILLKTEIIDISFFKINRKFES